MIRLNVFIRVKEEKREALLAAAKELVTASQKIKAVLLTMYSKVQLTTMY